MKHNRSDRRAGEEFPGIEGCEGEGIWQTRDMKEIVTLLALGHEPIPDGIVRKNETVWYCFKASDIAEDLVLYTSGNPLVVEVHDLWRNFDAFKFQVRQKPDGGE
jgi:hypothetical protein